MTQNHHYQLRSGLTIYPSQQKEIDQTLAQLLQNVPARFVLLTDVTGQIISARGEQEKLNLVALASLVAGDLAASQEIARLTGEYEDYQLVLREGQEAHIFISEAGSYLAMLVQVTKDVPLGWARMVIKKVAQSLPNILDQKPEDDDVTMMAEIQQEVSFHEENIDVLFDDALDDLWME
ncbi:hypothetical protein QUF58_11645 [Anaerolineales bacterium HSG24]|nr:hypothetical protein [Anaerolineales bacterium HSG24]